MSCIFVLGSLNIDVVVSSSYMPINGETVTGNGFMINPGGKGANQAVACAKMGEKVFMAGCVGKDMFGCQLIEELKNYDINVDNVRIIDDESTGTAVILLTDGDNRIILAPNANSKVSKNEVDKLLMNAQKGDIFITQLEIPMEVVGYGLICAKQKEMVTILNPAPANNNIKEYLKYVDIIIPNESELLGLLSKCDSIENMCKELHNLYKIPNIIVTLGSNGQALYRDDIYSEFKCMKVKAIDTTAAGDTFCGAFATQVSKGKEFSDALKFASIAASLAVTKKGAQKSIPTVDDVNKYL